MGGRNEMSRRANMILGVSGVLALSLTGTDIFGTAKAFQIGPQTVSKPGVACTLTSTPAGKTGASTGPLLTAAVCPLPTPAGARLSYASLMLSPNLSPEACLLERQEQDGTKTWWVNNSVARYPWGTRVRFFDGAQWAPIEPGDAWRIVCDLTPGKNVSNATADQHRPSVPTGVLGYNAGFAQP